MYNFFKLVFIITLIFSASFGSSISTKAKNESDIFCWINCTSQYNNQSESNNISENNGNSDTLGCWFSNECESNNTPSYDTESTGFCWINCTSQTTTSEVNNEEAQSNQCPSDVASGQVWYYTFLTGRFNSVVDFRENYIDITGRDGGFFRFYDFKTSGNKITFYGSSRNVIANYYRDTTYDCSMRFEFLGSFGNAKMSFPNATEAYKNIPNSLF
jgi:hypothetical protein